MPNNLAVGGLWDVVKSYYMTYEEIATHGDKKREYHATGLTFEKAKAMVDKLGFGYSMEPSTKRADTCLKKS